VLEGISSDHTENVRSALAGAACGLVGFAFARVGAEPRAGHVINIEVVRPHICGG
jgi:formaldehyde-activating enzyme involved in methanogenesis